MNIAKELKLPKDKLGNYFLTASCLDAEGKPRFIMPLINEFIELDAGIRFLAIHEMLYGGYEYASRKFFEMHLEPDDVFIDIGAHWGIFSLSAATLWRNKIDVIAIEPHPLNVTQLLKGVKLNQLEKNIEVIAAAVDEKAGIAALAFDSTMGHNLRGKQSAEGLRLQVPTITIDEIIAQRPHLKNRRIFMKIDVEGLEPSVLQGAKQLLNSGQLAGMLWEKGRNYNEPADHKRLLQMLEQLRDYGYEQFHFPQEYGGPLLPFACTYEAGNVFSLAKGFQRHNSYPRPFNTFPPYSNVLGAPAESDIRYKDTILLKSANSSDAARWCNPDELKVGAEERAQQAVEFIKPTDSVLDLGAGNLSLATLLPATCQYYPADLISRSNNCQVVDLNQQQFPSSDYTVIVLLEVLEYIHDTAWLLRKCRSASERLIISYDLSTDETDIEKRIQQGYFSHLTRQALDNDLAMAGWKIKTHKENGNRHYFECLAI